MNLDFGTLFGSVITSTAASSALIYLSKEWISERIKASIQHEYNVQLEAHKIILQNEYTQKLETHKAQLKSQTETEIEKLKADLQVVAAERNVRFSKIFEKTASTIEETYMKILRLQNEVGKYIWRERPSDKETNAKEKARLSKVIAENWIELDKFFYEHKLYIRKSTAKKVQEFLETITIFKNRYDRLEQFNEMFPENFDVLQQHEKSVDEVKAKIPALLASLEDEFQEVLGLKEPQTK